MRTTLFTALAVFLAPTLGLAQEPERPWTLMIYGAADNNADGPILEFLDGVRAALDDDAGMELVLFIDRSEDFSADAHSLGDDFTGARVYRLRKDSAELLDASEYFPGMTADEEYEVDSADPRNIGSFVAFCKKRFPARNYGLMIYSHADGCTMCPDEESGRDMHIPQLPAEVGVGASVDLLALELCNMGGIEIAYEWRPGNGGFSADYLLAIPNAGPPLDWDRAFARIRSPGHARFPGAEGTLLDPATMTAADFGALVIEEGLRGREAMAANHPEMAQHIEHEAAACYDLREADNVKRAVDALARRLAAEDGAKAVFEELRGPGRQGTVMNYVRDQFGPRPYADLYDFAARAAACDELGEEVRGAAADVGTAVDDFVHASFGMIALEGFEPGRHGVFIVLPQYWEAIDWYTPLPAAGGGDAPYGSWSFLADGATPGNGEVENWFELLDAWFDEADGRGGSNGYAF